MLINYFSLEELIGLNPSIRQNVDYSVKFDDWKFSLNITDIPLNRQAGIDAVGFEVVDTNLLGSDVVLGSYNTFIGETNYLAEYVLIKGKVKMDYSDVLGLFSYSLNKTHVEFRNITSNIQDNSLFIDPSVIFQDADTENLGDTWVNSALNATNYGADTRVQIRSGEDAGSTYFRRAYYKFNISEVVDAGDFGSFTEAQLYLNHTSRGFLDHDSNIDIHYVNNTVWNETIVTWGNQPCGDGEQSLNATCGASVDEVEVTEAAGLNIWYNWNATDFIANYNNSDKVISMLLVQNYTPTYDSFKGFATKEFADVDDRPYLNVTYSVAGNNAPVVDSLTVSDRDDADNLYSQQWYTSIINGSDADGYTEIQNMSLGFTDGVTWFNATIDVTGASASASKDSGGNRWSLGSVANVSSGNTVNATLQFKLRYNVSDALAIELYGRICDSSVCAAWSTEQNNYADIESDVSTTNFSLNDTQDWGNVSQPIGASWTVYYEGSVAVQPPDNNFTSGCYVHDSGEAEWGAATSLSGGICSVGFTSNATSSLTTYHGNMTNGEGSWDLSGSTDIFIADRIQVTFTNPLSTIWTGWTSTNFTVTLILEYNNTAVSSYWYTIYRNTSLLGNYSALTFTDISSSNATYVYNFTLVRDTARDIGVLWLTLLGWRICMCLTLIPVTLLSMLEFRSWILELIR
jgi:hypothetical protein